MKYPLTCQQIGQFGSHTVTPPVFAVRKGDYGQIDIIRPDTSDYEFFSGKLNGAGSLPYQSFYLIMDAITREDDDTQVVCINEDDVGSVDEYFSHTESHEPTYTTIVVPSAEGKDTSHTQIQAVHLTFSYFSFLVKKKKRPFCKMFKPQKSY